MVKRVLGWCLSDARSRLLIRSSQPDGKLAALTTGPFFCAQKQLKPASGTEMHREEARLLLEVGEGADDPLQGQH